MVTKFLQPTLHVLKGTVLGNIIDKQGTNCSSVVRRGDGPITLLPGSIPDLRLDGFPLGLDGLGGEIDSNSKLLFEVELVTGETR